MSKICERCKGSGTDPELDSVQVQDGKEPEFEPAQMPCRECNGKGIVKIPREAWKPGAYWTGVNEKGYFLEAIVVKPSRPNHKIVWMKYKDGPHSDYPVQQEYSHKHMVEYFTYTGETRPIPEYEERDPLAFLKEKS